MAKVSTKGYKKNSKDNNEASLRIPSPMITMKEDDGTPLRKGPILGIDNLGNQQMMYPGMDYQFPGNYVDEIPMAKMGGTRKVKIHALGGNIDPEKPIGPGKPSNPYQVVDGKYVFTLPDGTTWSTDQRDKADSINAYFAHGWGFTGDRTANGDPAWARIPKEVTDSKELTIEDAGMSNDPNVQKVIVNTPKGDVTKLQNLKTKKFIGYEVSGSPVNINNATGDPSVDFRKNFRGPIPLKPEDETLAAKDNNYREGYYSFANMMGNKSPAPLLPQHYAMYNEGIPYMNPDFKSALLQNRYSLPSGYSNDLQNQGYTFFPESGTWGIDINKQGPGETGYKKFGGGLPKVQAGINWSDPFKSSFVEPQKSEWYNTMNTMMPEKQNFDWRGTIETMAKPKPYAVPQEYYDELKILENSVKKGYTDGKFYPHESIEGGNKTIGYGHKVTDKDISSGQFKKGLGDAEATKLLEDDVAFNTQRAIERYDTRYGKGSFNKLHPELKKLAVDFTYNGINFLDKDKDAFPAFWGAANQYSTAKEDALKQKALQTMLANYHRGAKTEDNGKVILEGRNSYTKNVLDKLKKNGGELQKAQYGPPDWRNILYTPNTQKAPEGYVKVPDVVRQQRIAKGVPENLIPQYEKIEGKKVSPELQTIVDKQEARSTADKNKAEREKLERDIRNFRPAPINDPAGLPSVPIFEAALMAPVALGEAGLAGLGEMAYGAAAGTPLFQAAGAALSASPTALPGLSIGNAVNAGFAAHGLKTIVSGEAIEPWRNAAKTGNVSDYLSAAGQNLITGLETLPVTGPLLKGAAEFARPAVNAAGYRLPGMSLPMPEMPAIGPQAEATPWITESLPGLHLESTITGGPISKIVEPKTGLVNIEQALKIIGKESGGKEKLELVKNAIGENIPAKMDYNQFRKLIQDAIIPLERKTVNYNSNYGLGHIGFPSPKKSNIQLALDNSEQEVARLTGELDKVTNQISDIKGFKESVANDPSKAFLRNGTDEQIKTYLQGIANTTKEQLALSARQAENNRKMLSEAPLENETLLLSNKEKLGRGVDAHNNPRETLGHIHYYVDAENPNTAVMTQMQSDAFQGTHRTMPNSLEEATNKLTGAQEDLAWAKGLYLDTDHASLQVMKKANEEFAFDKATVENYVQKSLLDKKHQERYLQEFVDHAASKGMDKVRIPTSETAAKVQGYNPLEFDPGNAAATDARRKVMEAHKLYGPESKEFVEANANYDALVKNTKPEYIPGQKTILKKYEQMPKTIKKTFGEDVQIVTDGKGNTWYEFNIPANFREGKGEIKAFKEGGPAKRFNTKLRGAELEAFNQHAQQFPSLLHDNGDYDTQGFYQAVYRDKNGDMEAVTKALTPGSDTAHVGFDMFKKPNHPTFSKESKYYIPGLRPAGEWGHNQQGDYFDASRHNIRNMRRSDNTPLEYFKRAEDYNQNGVPDVNMYYRGKTQFDTETTPAGTPQAKLTRFAFQTGGSNFKTKLNPKEEQQFKGFYGTLPDNLRSDDASYDIRGYWDASGRPSEFDYLQPTEEDGYYHAFSRHPETGKILKSPGHPTFHMAVDERNVEGNTYVPMIGPDGNVYMRDLSQDAEDLQKQKHGGSVKRVKINALPNNWKTT
jgi:hypothetical protein